MKDPLDQTLFILNDADWKEFVKRLEAPAKPNAALIALLRRKPIWK